MKPNVQKYRFLSYKKCACTAKGDTRRADGHGLLPFRAAPDACTNFADRKAGTVRTVSKRTYKPRVLLGNIFLITLDSGLH